MSDTETTQPLPLYFDHTEVFEREIKPIISTLLDRATELKLPLFVAVTVRDTEAYLDTITSNVGVAANHSPYVFVRHAAMVGAATQPPTSTIVGLLAGQVLSEEGERGQA